MIQLYELIEQKRMLDVKITEIKETLIREHTEELAKEYLALVDARQDMLIKINKANNKSTINISDMAVPVSVAVIIRDSILDKIDTITEIISSVNNNLDIVNLQRQRDKFNRDCVLLDMVITSNDIRVDVG